ncbi:MAG: MFS transporter [Proteobacteria bacterium]|nr:MFS transporter [Pseudomonadota bacterium]
MSADPPTDPPADRPASNLPGIYPGWIMVAACFVLAFFAWGLGFYGHGFFIAALRAARGWSTGLLSGAVASFWFVGVPSALVVGRMLDRHGPRWIVLYGAVAMGVGGILVGQATEVWQIFALFMVMGSAYPALATAAISASLVPWFERRLGLALGLALSGASAGGVVMPPLLVWLASAYGFDMALAGVGIAVLLLVSPLALFVLRRPHDRAETAGERDRPPAHADRAAQPGMGDFIRSRAFWRIAAASTLALAAQVGFLMHQLPALEAELGLSAAAFAVSVVAGSAVLGRFVLGGLSLRIALPYLAAGCYLIQAAGLVLIVLGQGPILLYGGSALAGIVVGCIVMLPPLLLSDKFGANGYGTAYGLISAIMFLGASATTAMVGLLRDLTGGYTPAFLLLVVMELTAALVITWRRSRL